jgi:broad specificity phosphatase PhoE
MTRFCLIRHGQTDWNLEGRYQGQSDAPLNEAGREEARVLAHKLKGQAFDAIYSSDLQRARETAEIIAAALQLPVKTDSRLREINQGKWEGQLVEVIKARYANLWRQRKLDPASVRAPGGETVAEVAQRMYSALNEIAQIYPDGAVLIASHGLALATIICKAQGIPVGKAYTLIPDNTEPIWITWDAVL